MCSTIKRLQYQGGGRTLSVLNPEVLKFSVSVNAVTHSEDPHQSIFMCSLDS